MPLLPDELWLAILVACDVEALRALACVSQSFAALVASNHLWEAMQLRLFGGGEQRLAERAHRELPAAAGAAEAEGERDAPLRRVQHVGRAGGGVEGAGSPRGWGQPAPAARRARTARWGKGQQEGAFTSVSCPFMASICSWRPAIVASSDAWSDMMAGCVWVLALRESVTNFTVFCA